MAKATRARGAGPAPKRGPAPKSATPTDLTELQRRAGNRAVAALIESLPASLQRVPVAAGFHQTVYSRTGTGGSARAKGFAQNPTKVANPDKTSYELTRNADGTGVTVLVRIRFIQQARNTTPPPDPNPDNLPELGELVDPPTEIPANDPTDRRTWATATAAKATALWSGRRISFVSQDHPQPGEGAGSKAPPLPPTPSGYR